MDTSSIEPRTMSVAETCAELGVSRALVAKAVKEGALQGVRLGDRLLIIRSSFEKLLAGETQKPASPATDAE